MDQAIHRSHRHALSENTMSQAETERSPSAMLSGQDLVATVRRCMIDTGSIFVSGNLCRAYTRSRVYPARHPQILLDLRRFVANSFDCLPQFVNAHAEL